MTAVTVRDYLEITTLILEIVKLILTIWDKWPR